MTRLAILLRTSFLILTLICASQTMARSQKYKVTIKVKEQKLLDVFKSIQQQTNLIVFYSNTILNDQEKVSIQVKDEPLEKVLDKIIAGKALKYEVQEKYIVIAPKEEKKGVKEIKEGMSVEDVAPLPPPTIDVSGRVTDEDGNPLMGASVMIKGTKIGTQTNAEGYFTLKGVEEKAVLEISYVGFEKKELTANSMRVIKTLELKRSNSPLDAIQVEAYRTNTRRFSTSNIGTVTAAEIEKQPVQNPLLALQGRIPGVEITQETGMANGHVKVRIQGQNSIVDNRSEPLVIIDGIPYPTVLDPDGSGSPLSVNNASRGASPLSFVNPADIESVDILKDADATAIYGSRGANGVILITTKKGKAGKAKIDVKVQQGWGKVTRRMDLMNSRQYLDMRYEALRNDGLSLNSINDVDLKLWDTTRNTNWQKVLIGETAQYTNVNASISGGTSAAQYYIGGTFNRVTDVIPGDMANKSGSLHFNISTVSSNQRFKMNLSGSYMSNENKLPGQDLTEAALSFEPVAPALYNPDGTLNWAPNGAGSSTWENPLIYTQYRNVRHLTNNLLASAGVSYQVLPGLQVKSTFGYNSLNGTNFRGTPLEYFAPEDRINPDSKRGAFLSKTTNSSWIIEPQMTYQVKWKALKIDALIGATIQKNTNEYLRVSANGFTSNLLMESMQAAASTNVTSGRTPYRYAALFGRLNLNLDNKYILNVNVRRDGSSRFGDANKFHSFYSGAAAWIFTREKGLHDLLPFLSFGKLKSSYGVTGSDQIGDYQYISLYTTNTVQIPYQNIVPLFPNGLANPYLQWEEVRKFSTGIDLGFLNDRFLFSVNYARNECSNQLQNLRVPSTTGFTGIFTNFAAVVRNTSWEFSLNASIIKSKSFNWTSSLNLTLPNNKLVAFPDIENSAYAAGTNGVVIGQPLGVQKVFKYAGIDPATGTGLVYDYHGNPTANPSTSTDRTELISLIPDFNGGFNNSFSYKGFQLDFLFQFTRRLGSMDQYYFNRISPPGRFQAGLSNQPVSVIEGRWQHPGEEATMIRFSTTTAAVPRGYGSNAFFNYDASYIRLKNLAFSWQLPARWLKNAGLQSARINFQGQNLLTISNYSGLDPETRGGFSLPPLQVWTTGIQLTF